MMPRFEPRQGLSVAATPRRATMPSAIRRSSFRALALVLLGALCLTAVACGESSTSESGGGSQSAQTAPETSPDGDGEGGDEPNRYPATLAKPFMRSCTVTAVATAQGKLTRPQARAACAHTLACLERQLTVAELTATLQKMQAGEANPGAKVMRRCEQRAVEQVLG